MRAAALDIALSAAAFLCAAGFARYYVAAVLAGDRQLARAAGIGFVVLIVVAAISLLKILS